MFRNASEHTFKDISSEQYREYKFPGGDIVRIDAPQFLSISASGGHRIFDADGNSHYVPSTWVHLTWRVKDGEPHFSH